MFVILNAYRVKYSLQTVRDWISRWAPSADGNHTLAYVDAVCRRANIHSDAVVDTANEQLMTAIVAAMSFVENGMEPNLTEIKIGYKFFNP